MSQRLLASAYLSECRLLKALAKVLDLPAVATTTAFTYLHRIRLGGHPCQLTGQELVTACIYVAAKVDEVNVSANHLLNSARLLCHPSQQHLLQGLAPLDLLLPSSNRQQHDNPNLREGQAAAIAIQSSHAGPPADPQQQSKPQTQQEQQQHKQHDAPTLEGQAGHQQTPPQQQQQQHQQQAMLESVVATGDAYYAEKDRLFTAEQVVLRLMSFQLNVQQPHKQLLNFCNLLRVSTTAAAAAVCLLNDAVAYTGLCARYDAAVIAAAVLQLVLQLLEEQAAARQQSAARLEHAVNSSKGRQPSEHHRQGSSNISTGAHDTYRDRLQHGSNGSRRRSGSRDGLHLEPPGPSAAAAVTSAAVVRDGSWVGLVGLQHHQVDAVVTVLQQLLLQQEQGPE